MSISVYVVRTADSVSDDVFDYFMKFIQPEKKERILRQCVKSHARQMITAEILAKAAIKKEFGIDIKNQEFSCFETGKPYLANHNNIFFNISHSGEYAVCAVSDSEIGIDIQKIRKCNPDLIGRVCNEDEVAYLEKCTDTDSEFIKIWTAKEAVVKLYGTGISHGDIKNCIGNECIQSFRMGDYWLSVASVN